MVISSLILCLSVTSQPPKKQEIKPAPKKVVTKQVGSHAPEEKDNYAIGLDLGVTVPTGAGPALGFGVNAGYVFRRGKINIKPGFTTGFFTGSDSGSISDDRIGGTYSYTTTLTSIPLIVEGVVMFPLRLKILPFLGLGVGSTWVKVKEKFLDYTNSESKFVPSFLLSGGAEYPAGPGSVYLMLKYSYSKVNFLTSGSANSTGFGFFLGYRFYF